MNCVDSAGARDLYCMVCEVILLSYNHPGNNTARTGRDIAVCVTFALRLTCIEPLASQMSARVLPAFRVTYTLGEGGWWVGVRMEKLTERRERNAVGGGGLNASATAMVISRR